MRTRGIAQIGTELFDGRRWSEDEARRVIAAYAASGESVSGFATRHGIDSQRLYWWRRRLGDGVCEPRGKATVSLVPVTVREQPAACDGVAMVVSAEGVRIEVREVDATTASWVSMVVASLGPGRS